MSNTAFVHWNKKESNVYVNFNIHKPAKMKAVMFDGKGKCIVNVFDKYCGSGEFNAVKHIKDIAKGLYIMQFNSDEEQHVIRFRVN